MRRTNAGGISTRCYGMDKLEPVLSAVRSSPDTYLSQASFVSASRRVQYLQNIRAAWVDLDCYNIGAKPTDSFVREVLDLARQMGLPSPSYVVRSGRGLYAKWIFDEPITAASLDQWTQLQRTLVAIYRAIGADAKSRDAARVLRALGTVNSKASSSEEVHCCWNSGQTVSFMELCAHAAAVRFVGLLSRKAMDEAGITPETDGITDTYSDADESELIPSRSPEEEAQRRLKRAQARLAHSLIDASSSTDISGLQAYSQMREPIMLQRRSSQSLNWRRFLDLRDLAISRGGIPKGWRDEYLFWMANSLAHAQVLTPRNFWDEIEHLATIIEPDRKAFDPKRDGSMSTLFRRLCVERHTQRACPKTGLYRPSNDHLIELFDIKPQEQARLATLIDAGERERRRREANPERNVRRDQRQQREQLILQRLEQGSNVSQISAELGVSRQAVYRAKATLEKATLEPQRVSDVTCTSSARQDAVSKTPVAVGRRKPVRIGAQILNRVSDLCTSKSQREIAQDLGVPKSVVQRAMNQLRKMHVLPPSMSAGHQPSEAACDALDAQAIEQRSELLVELAAARQNAAQLAAAAETARQQLAAANATASLISKVAARRAPLAGADGTPDTASAAPGSHTSELQQQAQAARLAAEHARQHSRHASLLSEEAHAHAQALWYRLTGRAQAIEVTPPGEAGISSAGAPRSPFEPAGDHPQESQCSAHLMYPAHCRKPGTPADATSAAMDQTVDSAADPAATSDPHAAKPTRHVFARRHHRLPGYGRSVHARRPIAAAAGGSASQAQPTQWRSSADIGASDIEHAQSTSASSQGVPADASTSTRRRHDWRGWCFAASRRHTGPNASPDRADTS